MGAFFSSATDILELLTNILLVHLRLANTCHQEALRLCTLPMSYPLSWPVKQAARHSPQFHPSPIHTLLHSFNLHLATIETMNTIRQYPSWMPGILTHIACNNNEVASWICMQMNNLTIYTDRAGFMGHAGAAATMHPCGVAQASYLQHRLGKLTLHT